MAQVIKIKRSTGSSAPGTLAVGELAYSKGSDTFYVGDPEAANTPIAIGGAIKNNAGTAVLATGITAAEIRTLAGVDAAGTDNSTVANLRTNLTAISDSTTIGDGTDVAITIAGNLIVNGTTTTVNSATVTIDDPIFTLGGDSAPGSDDNKDRGLEFRWHNGSAAKVGFFGFDDSAGKFTFIPDATNNSEIFSGTAGTIVANLEGAVTGNVTGNASGTAATVTTAAQTNITSLGTLTALTVDDVAIDGKVVTMTGSSGDTATLTVGTNGTLDITTVDTAAAAANMTLTADGAWEAVGSTITLDSGGAINLEPAAGSAILLDGTISVDGGVVTGATSITSTAFVGALTGNVAGNVTGNLIIGGHTVDDIDITSEASDADDHLMTALAIKNRIEDYGYSTTTGDILSVQITSTDASITGVGTASSGAAVFDLQVGEINGGTY
tara:strand:+ start:130 stop:1449 length:1320 start_codon:yes stop_codon:yes gene_type:complete